MSKTLQKQRQVPMIRQSAHQIWLAGLGALSLAEDESGKFFRSLVKRGTAFEHDAKDRFADMKEKFNVRKAAGTTVDRIGDGLDDGMTDVLHRLGLPTKKEIEGLTKRVEHLTKTLEARPVKTPSRRTPAKRRAVRHVAESPTAL